MSNQMVERWKQQLFGKMFQWVRPINNEQVGEIVRVTNVRQKGEIIVAEFSSGTPVNVIMLQTYLTPYNNEEPALLQDKVSTVKNEQVKPQKKANSVDESEEVFKHFNAVETKLDLKLVLKIPDMALVKMMYKNAADGDKFLTDMSKYIYKHISTDSIKQSVKAML